MFIEPFSIVINSNKIRIGDPLPQTIHYFEVTIHMPMHIQTQQVPLVKQWLNDVIDKLECEYVIYNGILIPSDELQKF